MEDLKTYIPGVGLLITAWDGSAGRLISDEELNAPSETYGEKFLPPNEEEESE